MNRKVCIEKARDEKGYRDRDAEQGGEGGGGESRRPGAFITRRMTTASPRRTAANAARGRRQIFGQGTVQKRRGKP